MAGKIGEEYFRDMVDRGRRELGGVLFQDSTIAQPMYPLRGYYGAKETPSPELPDRESSFEELHPVDPSHDVRDDRERGMERE
jgi:hypothetical protein